MARIEFIDIGHSYSGDTDDDRTWALSPMSVTWNDGGAYALLGPSGCGKTTLLNIVSGLIRPTQGKVLFDGVNVSDLPPEKRNIAQVFQFPVIYDTMTVYDNLAFPLRNRRWTEKRARPRVQEIAELLELSNVLGERAHNLTADAKQKISLGRGLVRPDVAAVLFDEPLTVIDPQLKWLLRRKLKQIHSELKLTLIYVTHDQTEALTFADTVVVMSQGNIVQSGTAQQLFETPAHAFVGNFIGSPGMNFLPCSLGDGHAQVEGESVTIDPARIDRARSIGSAFALGIRPEFIEVVDQPLPQTHPVAIESIRPMGAYTMISARFGSQSLAIKSRNSHKVNIRNARIRFVPNQLHLFANERRVP